MASEAVEKAAPKRHRASEADRRRGSDVDALLLTAVEIAVLNHLTSVGPFAAVTAVALAVYRPNSADAPIAHRR